MENLSLYGFTLRQQQKKHFVNEKLVFCVTEKDEKLSRLQMEQDERFSGILSKW